MYFLSVFLRPFRLVSNLTPSAFANNTSFIIPQIVELRFPSGILISFRSFEMMPHFTPQGSFLVASYLFKKKSNSIPHRKLMIKKRLLLIIFIFEVLIAIKNQWWCHNKFFLLRVCTYFLFIFYYYPLFSWRYSFSWVFSSEVFRILKAWSNLFSCLNSQ